MTKRLGSFGQSTSKKQKFDLDDLWGEDIDISVLDDCILKATQASQKENIDSKQNDSILPSYNAFQQKDLFLFTSTQESFMQLPSTSKFDPLPNSSFAESNHGAFKRPAQLDPSRETTIQKLQLRCEAKEGEISILRSQLEQVKLNLQSSHIKREKELSERLQSSIKETSAVKSELEFKNLDIANLRHKIREVSKFELNINHAEVKNKTCHELERYAIYKENYSLTPFVEIELPLKDKVSLEIFHVSKVRDLHVDLNVHKTSKPLLNQLTQRNTPPLCKNQSHSKLSIDFIYNDIAFFMTCTLEDMNNEENYFHINKVICLVKLLLIDFCNFLKEVQSAMVSDCIRSKDRSYLEGKTPDSKVPSSIVDSKEWCEEEIGIKLRQILAFMSEVLPYSKYLQELILNNTPLYVKNDTEIKFYFHEVKIDDMENKINKSDILNMLLSSVTIIGGIRKSDNCTGYLSAAITLLSKICGLREFNIVSNVVFKIMHEIIFCRPSEHVLHFISIFLRDASLHSNFVETMCKMRSRCGLKKNSKNIPYFDSNCCFFQVFAGIYHDYLLKFTKTDLFVETNLNMLRFIINAFNSKHAWLHYKENEQCDCICKVNELSIEILYELLKFHEQDLNVDQKLSNPNVLQMFTSFMKILHILHFKNYELIEKNITSCTHFKVVLNALLRSASHLGQKDVDLLELINQPDEIQDVNSDVINLPVWKL